MPCLLFHPDENIQKRFWWRVLWNTLHYVWTGSTDEIHCASDPNTKETNRTSTSSKKYFLMGMSNHATISSSLNRSWPRPTSSMHEYCQINKTLNEQCWILPPSLRCCSDTICILMSKRTKYVRSRYYFSETYQKMKRIVCCRQKKACLENFSLAVGQQAERFAVALCAWIHVNAHALMHHCHDFSKCLDTFIFLFLFSLLSELPVDIP